MRWGDLGPREDLAMSRVADLIPVVARQITRSPERSTGLGNGGAAGEMVSLSWKCRTGSDRRGVEPVRPARVSRPQLVEDRGTLVSCVGPVRFGEWSSRGP